jgi:hypothetical protein
MARISLVVVAVCDTDGFGRSVRMLDPVRV